MYHESHLYQVLGAELPAVGSGTTECWLPHLPRWNVVPQGRPHPRSFWKTRKSLLSFMLFIFYLISWFLIDFDFFLGFFPGSELIHWSFLHVPLPSQLRQPTRWSRCFSKASKAFNGILTRIWIIWEFLKQSRISHSDEIAAFLKQFGCHRIQMNYSKCVIA